MKYLLRHRIRKLAIFFLQTEKQKSSLIEKFGYAFNARPVFPLPKEQQEEEELLLLRLTVP